jgi:putative transposase
MKRILPSENLVKEFEQRKRAGEFSLKEYILRGAQLMLQKAVEEEVQEFLDRGHYERAGDELRGYRNGYETKKIRTGEGVIEVEMPQVRNAKERFRSSFIAAYLKRTEMIDKLILNIAVKGLSLRDIEQTMFDILSGDGISRSVLSRISDQLRQDFERWRKRDLSKEEILYLFLDGSYWKMRDGEQPKEAILVGYGIRWDGKKILLHVALGNKESYDCWLAFLHDQTERGLNEPMMVICDGSPGAIKACKEIFPHALKQRCQVHNMRNILARLPKAMISEIKPLIQQVFTADSYEKGLAAGHRLIKRFKARFPAAIECFEKDLEATIQCLRLPAEHRTRVRTTNILERLLEEAKRRTKVIPYFQSEKSCMKFVFATMIVASRLWRGVHMTVPIEKQLNSLKERILNHIKAA